MAHVGPKFGVPCRVPTQGRLLGQDLEFGEGESWEAPIRTPQPNSLRRTGPCPPPTAQQLVMRTATTGVLTAAQHSVHRTAPAARGGQTQEARPASRWDLPRCQGSERDRPRGDDKEEAYSPWENDRAGAPTPDSISSFKDVVKRDFNPTESRHVPGVSGSQTQSEPASGVFRPVETPHAGDLPTGPSRHRRPGHPQASPSSCCWSLPPAPPLGVTRQGLRPQVPTLAREEQPGGQVLPQRGLLEEFQHKPVPQSWSVLATGTRPPATSYRQVERHLGQGLRCPRSRLLGERSLTHAVAGSDE